VNQDGVFAGEEYYPGHWKASCSIHVCS